MRGGRRRIGLLGTAVVVVLAAASLGSLVGPAAGAPAAPTAAEEVTTVGKRHPEGRSGLLAKAYWRNRQDGYLAHATSQFVPSSIENVIAHAERHRRDPAFPFAAQAVTPTSFQGAYDRIDNYQDTADFPMMSLVMLWYRHRDLLRADTVAAIERRFIDFRYWWTDPPPPAGIIDQRYFWTENHQLIFRTLEYLVGQAFPDTVFTNDGRTGAQHQARAAAKIDDWLAQRARLGWTEWHSNVYYQKDLEPLVLLVELASDRALRTKATIVLDLLLYDIALHLHKGTLGATHGRSYMKDKSRATDEDTFNSAKLLFNDTKLAYQSIGDRGAVFLAASRRYRVPTIIWRVARSRKETVDRERMNVPLDPNAPVVDDPVAPFGYAFDEDHADFWLERNAMTAWQYVVPTIALFDRYDLWDNEFFSAFKPLRDLFGDDPPAAKAFVQSLAPMLGFALLSEVNSYTYRNDHVMLSSAQSYRPGNFGDQTHAWQATLDEQALVFTTHPKNEPLPTVRWPDEDGYWTGSGSLPRSVQERTAGISIYAPIFADPGPGLLDRFRYLDYTHAYFPQERFDEVVRTGNWTFGRRGDGYVALYSWRPTEWRAFDPAVYFTNGLTEPFDLVAPGGADNVWIVEVGDADRYEDFAAFRAAVSGAEVTVTARPTGEDGLAGGFDVAYDSPGAGRLSFGTTGGLTVDGADRPISGYPRFDNRWSHVPFDASEVRIADRHASLDLDLAAWTRTAAAGA